MPVERYARALAEAEAEAGLAAEITRPAPSEPTAPMPLATPGAPSPGAFPFHEPALAAAERHRTLEPLVRQQMVARLRDSHVLPEVKQFLLGPWLAAVLHEVVAHGDESPGAPRVLRAVETQIEAGRNQRRGPLSRAELDCHRMEAEDGLATAGLPAARIGQHVQDLAAALAVWPRPEPRPIPASPPKPCWRTPSCPTGRATTTWPPCRSRSMPTTPTSARCATARPGSTAWRSAMSAAFSARASGTRCG
jgi:hypothetical protein